MSLVTLFRNKFCAKVRLFLHICKREGKKKSSVGVIWGILGRKRRKWEAGGVFWGRRKAKRNRLAHARRLPIKVGWIYYHRIKVSTFPVVWLWFRCGLLPLFGSLKVVEFVCSASRNGTTYADHRRCIDLRYIDFGLIIEFFSHSFVLLINYFTI